MSFLLLVAQALAYDSEPQTVLLTDEAPVFSNVSFSTGVIPSGSPVGVQFDLGTKGGTDVRMEGEANLSWPDNVTFATTGDAGKGYFQLDASLDAITSVVVDLSSYGGPSGNFEIDHRALNMDGRALFDPFALEGSANPRVEVVDTTDSTQLINYSYEIFSGISLDLTADMTPTITVGFEGVKWLANEGVIAEENTPVVLTPEQGADFVVDTVFRGAYDGTISLVFTPQVAVTAPFLGTIPLVSFDYPIDLLTDAFEQDFATQSYTFPMPLLVPGSESEDFGEVEVDQIATIDVPITNEGHLALEGSASIEGDGTFTVYPTQFHASPGGEDGLVVTYAPSEVGSNTAELVLTSNDPGYPDIRIALTGEGVKTDQGQDVNESVTASTSGCGCDTTPAASLSAVGLGLAALTLARRRRA